MFFVAVDVNVHHTILGVTVDLHACIYVSLKLEMAGAILGSAVGGRTMLDPRDAVVSFQLVQPSPGLGAGGRVAASLGGHGNNNVIEIIRVYIGPSEISSRLDNSSRTGMPNS